MSTVYATLCQKYIHFAVVLPAILLFILSGVHKSPDSAGAIYGEIPSSPIQVKVEIDRIPTLGQTATVTCTTQALLDSPGTAINLVLPSKAELFTGDLHRKGLVRSSQPTILTASYRFNEMGDVAISCKAYRKIDSKNSWGDLDTIYLSIGDKETKIGFANIGIPYGQSLSDGEGDPIFTAVNPAIFRSTNNFIVTPPTTEMSRSSQAPQPSSQSLAGTLTITGRWAYFNRNDIFVGANQFLIELVKGDDAAHLAWCYTDTNGYYSCGPVANPGNAGIRTYLRSFVNYNPYGDVLQVTWPPCGIDVYCTYPTQTGQYIFADGTHDIGTWHVINGNIYEGAYWLKADLDRAYKFVWSQTGSSQNPQETAGPGTILWSFDSTDGTYYRPGEQIHLKGEDRLTPDVSIHEYGHNVMYNIYQSMPMNDCPSNHVVQLASGPNCAWVEGWADFFPLAVTGNPVFNLPGAALNLETPTWGTSNWENGDRVEGRVAGALWDIYDSTNEGSDQFTDGFANIWDTIFHQNDNKFSEYWSAWKQRGHNANQAVRSVYQNTIDYLAPKLLNPSFENDANNDGKPDVWSQNAIFTRSTAIPAIDGSFVGRFHINNNTGATIQQVVKDLVAGRIYEFSGWVKIPATSDTFNFRLQVKWRDASNTVVGTSLVKTYTAQTTAWNQAKATMVAPAGTTNAVVQMVVTSLNATIYVDKFQFYVP